MSTGENPENIEEMSSALPPLKWSEEIFNDLVKSFKFLASWGVIFPQEGKAAAQSPAGYITLFWDYFAEGNFQLPATKFVLVVLGYYKFHISQLHPMGMVRIRHFEFVCQSMGIEPLLPERALVAAKMSLHWKFNTKDKPVYVEDKTAVALYMVAYKRENGKMTTVQLGAGEETWYRQIVKNFALPKDADLNAQPSTDVGELINLGVGPESKKRKRRPVASAISKKADAPKADMTKEEKKKGTCPVTDSWCDYVVVSDSLEGLAPVAVKHPKAEPRDTADIPPSNP
ncbi:hypothetical protein HanPI659440_Chr03g0096461 [Helianthus annuus]|nr:hypothetical protein HanPI659440_Chr03g0096461 [Helianthus annuus]